MSDSRERRLEDIAAALRSIASLELDARLRIEGDGGVLDAVAASVNMLAEELAAYVEERASMARVLEERIRERTAELVRANSDLQREIEQRSHAEANLAALVEALPDAVFVSQNDIILYANPAMARLLDCDRTTLAGAHVDAFLHPDDHEALREFRALRAASAANRSSVEARWLRADGTAVLIHGFSTAITYDCAPAWVSVCRDITELGEKEAERTRTEKALRLSDERHRLLFDCSPLPITLFDADTLRILAVNDAAVRLYGFTKEELTAMRMPDLKLPEDVPELVKGMETRGDGKSGPVPWHGTKRHRKKDGSFVELEINSHLISVDGRRVVMALGSDVTETRRLEAQLRHAQKMEAVGQLAGGVAHDFNNMLAVILGDASFALESLGPEHPSRAEIKEIESVAKRAAGLTKQLLTFSRRNRASLETILLNAIVVDVEKMLRRIIGEDTRLSLALDAETGYISADKGHLEQVLVNLVVNARDAIGGHGTVAIETREVVLAPRQAADLGVTAGVYVMLAVTDSGCGMDEATRARVFEPFFTTKGVGQGTGLGLSIVFGIVSECGGAIAIESEPGRGSTFRVYFPRTSAAAIATTNRPQAAPRGSETILVVEDDDQVRTLVRRILAARGYRVLVANGAAAALKTLDASGDEIALVVTDMVMPDTDGPTMARQILAARPAMKLLYMSGYTEHRALRGETLGADDHFIAKPFSVDGLALAVRRVLDGEPAQIVSK